LNKGLEYIRLCAAFRRGRWFLCRNGAAGGYAVQEAGGYCSTGC